MVSELFTPQKCSLSCCSLVSLMSWHACYIGVEPWTFEQKLGEAVFIPAGCPHQVRNLKSCIKVAMDFVSPENVDECIKLTGEFRRLPSHHKAKEDKLEIKKIALYALNQVINFLDPPSDG